MNDNLGENMRNLRIISFLFCTLSLSIAVAEQFIWESVSGEQKEVKLSVSENKINDWPIRAVKGEIIINKNFVEIIAAISDHENTKKWVKNAIEAKVLEMSPKKRIVYRKYKGVKPFKARDVILEITSRYDPFEKAFNIFAKSVDHPLAPPVGDGVHRAKMYFSKISLKILDKSKTQVIITSVVDLQGWIPSILNLKHNRETTEANLVALKNLVEKNKFSLSKKLINLRDVIKL